MNKITINGKDYPMRKTMGAFVQFKRNRGVDVSEIGNDVDSVCYFIYECVKSACRVDNVPFDFSFEDFTDNIDISVLFDFQNSQDTEQAAASKKK